MSAPRERGAQNFARSSTVHPRAERFDFASGVAVPVMTRNLGAGRGPSRLHVRDHAKTEKLDEKPKPD